MFSILKVHWQDTFFWRRAIDFRALNGSFMFTTNCIEEVLWQAGVEFNPITKEDYTDGREMTGVVIYTVVSLKYLDHGSLSDRLGTLVHSASQVLAKPMLSLKHLTCLKSMTRWYSLIDVNVGSEMTGNAHLCLEGLQCRSCQMSWISPLHAPVPVFFEETHVYVRCIEIFSISFHRYIVYNGKQNLYIYIERERVHKYTRYTNILSVSARNCVWKNISFMISQQDNNSNVTV